MSSAPKIHQPAAAALLALAFLLPACSRERPAPAPASETPQPEEALRKLHVLTAEGELVVALKWDADEVQIFFGEGETRRVLRSRLGPGRQRRWNERGVGPVALVRSNEKGDAFTIRSADGKTVFLRVRLGKQVALVRDLPGSPGFDIRQQRRGNRIQVKSEDGTDLGRVEIHAKTGNVRVFDSAGTEAFQTTRNAPVSMLYGALLAPEIEPTVRYILMAELLVR